MTTKTVRCQTCNLDCDPGDYGTLQIAATPMHFAIETDGFATPAESTDDVWQGQQPCTGSHLLGYVRPV